MGEDPPLLPFLLLIFAFVLWILLVAIFIPRLLGSALAFVANRYFRDVFHISIPSLYIYPLAGRVVAHSLQYTIPNGTISIQQLVLQCRWWRKPLHLNFRELLTVNDPQNLDFVAEEQQAVELENDALFFIRISYRLRRWWHRTAVTSDPNTSIEPRPLISLVCVGLRARIVNDKKNYDHISKVLSLARTSARQSSSQHHPLSHFPSPNTNEQPFPLPSAFSPNIHRSSSSASSYSSVQSLDEKPWQHRILELLSLRITDGAFYFSDMGQSPLVRLSLKSAKLRYRYGKPACPADECRKRIRLKASGFYLSVSSHRDVQKVTATSATPNDTFNDENLSPIHHKESETDHLIQRIFQQGHKGLRHLFDDMEAVVDEISSPPDHSSDQPPLRPNSTQFFPKKREPRESKTTTPLHFTDVVVAKTAIVDYVFDEPGPVPCIQPKVAPSTPHDIDSVEPSAESLENQPAPLCKISVLLRRSFFCYDLQAKADIEMVLERLQPVFYDLRSLARSVQSGEAKRVANGIQIELEATPETQPETTRRTSSDLQPLIKVPFVPQHSTWNALLAMKVRQWGGRDSRDDISREDSNNEKLPASQLVIFTSKLSLRTEVPYQVGVPQRTLLSTKEMTITSEGVTNIPLLRAKTFSLNQIVHYPLAWNDEHPITSDMHLSDSEFFYLPDTLRVIEDLSTTARRYNRKPESVRYFVPFRETIKIHADKAYRIILSCSFENMWHDIEKGVADEYGRIVISGNDGELALTPNTATEFVPDAMSLSWSISIPNAVGKMEFSVSQEAPSMSRSGSYSDKGQALESAQSGHERGRTSSFAYFGRTRESMEPRHLGALEKPFWQFGFDIIHAGSVCTLKGKVISHQRKTFLETATHAFLDSVNRSELHLRASSLEWDLNPHHMTSVLNLIRTYGGSGAHNINADELQSLTERRHGTARSIMAAARYPQVAECLLFGLPAGTIMTLLDERTALDDVQFMTFQIDELIIRLHHLPDAMCPFEANAQNVCSFDCGKLFGSLSSNRLGMELLCSTSRRDNLVVMHPGYRSKGEHQKDPSKPSFSARLNPPTLTLSNLNFRKRTWSDPENGPYHSELLVQVGRIKGCLLDTFLASLVGIGSSAIPHAIHEDSAAVAALLATENIEVSIGDVDVLILSASSTHLAEKSGQLKNLFAQKQQYEQDQSLFRASVPVCLKAVTQVQVPLGLRYVASTIASLDTGFTSRIFIPNVDVDSFMPWGEKLIPWIDDITMRVLVGHVPSMQHETTADSRRSDGLLRRVMHVKSLTLDIVMGTRPFLWSACVPQLQRKHGELMQHGRYGEVLDMYCEKRNGLQANAGSIQAREVLQAPWWMFLRDLRRSALLDNYVERNAATPQRLELLSIIMPTKVVVRAVPDALEIALDILVRTREHAESEHEKTAPSRLAGLTVLKGANVTAERVVELWEILEHLNQQRSHMHQQSERNIFLKALETKEIRFILISSTTGNDSKNAESFSLDKYEGETLRLSLPFGAQFLQTRKTETTTARDEHKSKYPHGKSSVTRHGYASSGTISCNERELAFASGLLAVYRQTVWNANGNHKSSGAHKRHSFTGRISNIFFGSQDSSLASYACFGRSVSILLLMSRALRLERHSLGELRRRNTDELCETIFAINAGQLRKAKTDILRKVLTLAAVNARSQRAFHSASSSSHARTGAFSFPITIPGEHITKEKESPLISSFNLSVLSLVFKAEQHNIAVVASFRCEGGHRYEQNTRRNLLDGYTVNTNFGSIRLSVRDDIAANALREVAEVASFVRAKALSLPMLRSELSDAKEGMPENINSSYSRLKDERRLRPMTRKPLNHAVLPSYWLEKRSWKPRSPSIRRRALSRSRSQRSHLEQAHIRNAAPIPSFEKVGSSSSLHLSSPPSRNLQSFSDYPYLVPGTRNPDHNRSIFMQEQVNTTETPFQNDGMRGTINSQAISQKRPILHSSMEGSSTQKLMPVRSFYPHGHGGTLNDQHYACVAIATAGESGPPRKRSKSMIPVGVMPPAFSSDIPRSSSQALTPDVTTDSQQVWDHGKDLSVNGKTTRSDRMTLAAALNQTGPTKDRELPRWNKQAATKWKREKTSNSPITLFVSCDRITSYYFRGAETAQARDQHGSREADIYFSISEPRITFMSSPQKGSRSIVITALSGRLKCANDSSCILTGSIARLGLTSSFAHGNVPTTRPTLIVSAKVTKFATTLQATDLRSVLTFRERFKKDLKDIVSSSVLARHSIVEMARAARVSSAIMFQSEPTFYSTLAFDLLCESSMIKLQGFHPKDSNMSISYLLDGFFFSFVASDDDSAALTLGLRLYGHGLSLSAPSSESIETMQFPSFDARGVQWGETTGLPTILKVTAEPLMNSTSVQGLRLVLFTISGLLAFQNVPPGSSDAETFPVKADTAVGDARRLNHTKDDDSGAQSVGTPFSRSYAAWERTKAVRMDISIQPMSFSLVSGEVLALVDIDVITGIFEWSKLVLTGVQLHGGTNVPRISLSLLRGNSHEQSSSNNMRRERRTSMSIALERARVDLVKVQEDLTHKFTFRIDIFAVSGQIRPWKVMLDLASWADEQEFVSDLQAINYNAAVSGRQRQPRAPRFPGGEESVHQRIILTGARVHRVILAVPLLSTEEHSSSRLAFRATDMHFFARERFSAIAAPVKNVILLKTHFIGILWENSALLSTHHARVSFGTHRPVRGGSAHFGATHVVMSPGTWRICPRNDVIIAIIEAKNRKDNKHASEKTRELLATLPEMASRPGSSTAADSLSMATEKQGRLLFESLTLKTLRTSGFIEGLNENYDPSFLSLRHKLQSDDPARFQSKLSVPAFSVAIVRDLDHEFDIIDVDFTGREGGSFPAGCFRKLSDLFKDLFAALNADRDEKKVEMPSVTLRQPLEHREMTRDLSLLLRFGKSLYRAQEAVNSSMEAQLGFFAGKASSLLFSVYTTAMFEEEAGYSTVITGISPRLGLEITPILEDARVQSLRLVDARLLHGLTPSLPPHTMLHVSRVTALMEAKTLLRAQTRLGSVSSVSSRKSDKQDVSDLSSSLPSSSRCLSLVFGKPLLRDRTSENINESEDRGQRIEPDIRIQMKFPVNGESEGDEVDFFVQRCMVGFWVDGNSIDTHACRHILYGGFHKVAMRAQWDLLSCKLQLREVLACYDASGTSPQEGGVKSISSVFNRLQFESMQYGRNTSKVDVDAIAAMWSVPTREVLVESTLIRTEIAYTLQKARAKFIGQVKKLRNEVRLLTEKDLSRESKREGPYEHEDQDQRAEKFGYLRDDEVGLPTAVLDNSKDKVRSDDEISPRDDLQNQPWQTRVIIRGDELVVTMRGYQFDESRHSARVAVSRYDLGYCHGSGVATDGTQRRFLDVDFADMRLTYLDDDRGIHSDLFKVPSPRLHMSIVERDDVATVDLQGTLLVALKHGFYYLQDFKKLAELTVLGIEHTTSSDLGTETENQEESAGASNVSSVWNGKRGLVTVNLNPKIDVMGDLTEDMLHLKMISSRLGKAEMIPKQMYDFIIIPLEAFSRALCEPLYK